MSLLPPLNFNKWVSENGHLLQPPVNNFLISRGEDFTVMAVGGPNSRNDYHINMTEEWFFQQKGRMLLKVIENEQFKDVYIDEGEMFLLPPNTPHNPCRFENTIGIVIERVRPTDSIDSLVWFCPNSAAHSKPHIIAREDFHCTDLGTQLKPLINAWKASEEKRTCKECGTVAPPA